MLTAEPEWQAEAFAFLYGLLGGAPSTAANVLLANPDVRARLHRAIYERRPRDEPYDDMMARLCPHGLPTAEPIVEMKPRPFQNLDAIMSPCCSCSWALNEQTGVHFCLGCGEPASDPAPDGTQSR